MDQTLLRHLVAAGFAAGRAIIKAVLAEADVNLSLAEAAVLFASALIFGHFALHAAVSGFGGSGHKRSLARGKEPGKVPLVTRKQAPDIGRRTLGRNRLSRGYSKAMCICISKCRSRRSEGGGSEGSVADPFPCMVGLLV